MKSISILLSAVVCTTSVSLHAQSVIHDTQSTLTEWIGIEKDLAKEKSDWKYEKEIIKDTIRVLQEEKELLKERIKSAKEATSTADGKRIKLNEEKQVLVQGVEELAKEIEPLEAEARKLYQFFPEPMQEEIAALYNRIPDGTKKGRLPPLSTRLQSVVGILSQADKFNAGITLKTEIKELESGTNAEVQTLYFGLGGAYYSDSIGTYAGVGTPTPEGWVWEKKPEAGPLIADIIASYQSTQEAAFIDLPVVIK